MKKTLGMKILSVLLVIATLMVSLPLSVFAEELQPDAAPAATGTTEVYMKSIKIAQAQNKEDAKKYLEEQGYIFLDRNLNEGTGADGIWIGYTTTTDPTEAIYDIKLMHTEGGYTLTSMDEVYESQQSAFAQMATDLGYLIEEFIEAYNKESIPAQKAYMALNFFRIVDGETTPAEQNGLGYQIVNGYMTQEKITNMILFCDGTILDSVVKLLTMGIQLTTDNWMEALTKQGVYKEGTSYGTDSAEVKRRAKELLTILQLYAETYNAMDKMGLVSGRFDEQGNIVGSNITPNGNVVPAQSADLVKVDIGRVQSYKLVFDELAKHQYGDGTLKDFICSLATEKDEKVLYPLVSIMTDGEFAAVSYGCFLEYALGANAKTSDFNNYDDAFKEATKNTKSLYLYEGVNSVLLHSDTVIGFTDTASRHMALTGEYQFYEKESWGENAFETGRFVALGIGATGMVVMASAKLTLGIMSFAGVLSAATAQGATGFLAGTAKICAVVSGGYATLIVVAAAALAVLVSYIMYIVDEDDRNSVDWDANPIPEYIYDVKEVGFTGTSENDGIETDYIKKPVFVFYEAVRDDRGRAADLNARSENSSKWIAMYVSYDRPGDDSKPIKAEDFLVQTGNGEIPEGYVPVSRFESVISYNLNQWDKKDDVNGIYMFYQQDQNISVDSDQTYYIYEVYLQTGESTAHCLRLLEAAGYTPLNVNLSPDYESGFFVTNKVFTYLGYKLTTNPNNAITDLRMEYGTSQNSVQFGGITYASCGNSAGVTLYATKYRAAGTPILAAGLKCYNNRYDAEAGYEPVNLFSGGMAQSFNTKESTSTVETEDYFLYFLPETTFTSGPAYLGGVSYYYCDDDAYDCYYFEKAHRDQDDIILDYLKNYTGEDFSTATKDDIKYAMENYLLARVSGPGFRKLSEDNVNDIFVATITYNPYRAIYGIKGSTLKDISNQLIIESQGYVAWDVMFWDGDYSSVGVGAGNVNYNLELKHNAANELKMSGTYYVSGNPSKTNVYDPETRRMTESQPLEQDWSISLLDMSDGFTNMWGYYTYMKWVQESHYVAVGDIFSSSNEPITVTRKYNNGTAEYRLFVRGSEEVRPYISAVTAIDKLTIFRASGGSDSGLKRSDITNNMLLTQLARQGATHFASINTSMYREVYWTHLWNPSKNAYEEMNTTKFGYTRTDDEDAALTDLFIYTTGFTNEDPPREIYRGKVKYTLLCQLSGNLTGYEDAPAPSAYLYGTTDDRAGGKIIDIAFTASPFMDGYETVRTKDGRSMWAEITDYAIAQKNNNFMSGAKTLFNAIAKFFGFACETDEDSYYDDLRAQKYYYIHIQREGDDLRTQKPYIGELYLATQIEEDKSGGEKLQMAGILDSLFDQGAEAYLDLDLNAGASSYKYVYLGYSYTADPNDAITGIRPYHGKYFGSAGSAQAGNIKYYSVGDINLNAGAGGDEIYLYYTKSHHEDAGKPITEIRYCKNSAPSYSETADAEILPVMRYDSWNPSDLNGGVKGSSAIYLTVVRPFETPMGTYKAPNYGTDKTTTRKVASGSAEGKYIAVMYVMDKNTIRQEKLAAGVASADCTCAKITDQEVIDRLKQMGATTVLTTPISIKGGAYGKNNDNKVFIGYSRTNDYRKAIKDIAIKAEVVALKEPDALIDIGKLSYTLVAEAATKVTELPKAINLIGVQDGQDLLIPKLYLYTTTSGEGEPIYDISIDNNPLKEGWITARSENELEPFYDIYQQAKKHAELGAKDDTDSYDSEIVYTDELYKWMDEVATLFNPAKEKINPFFIHCKKIESDAPVKEVLPYISEIYVAAGGSKLDALSQLAAYEPHGYLDRDLNEGAGGDYVYIAYRRTDDRNDAITDIAISFTDTSDRIWIGQTKDKLAPYDLASHVNLNSGVWKPTADSLYLYVSKSPNTLIGEPINDLDTYNHSYSTKDENGFWTDVTAYKAFYDNFNGHYYLQRELGVQDGDPDLNDGAGGKYIYLIMKRTPPSDNASDMSGEGTILGPGSIVAICTLTGVAILVCAAIVIVNRKKKECE